MNIPRVGITQFNQNISKWINRAVKGEIVYLTVRGKSVAVIMSKKNLDAIAGELLERMNEEWLKK